MNHRAFAPNFDAGVAENRLLRQLLLDELIDSGLGRSPIALSIASVLLYGLTNSIASHPSSDLNVALPYLGTSPANWSMTFKYSGSELYSVALKNAMTLLQQSHSNLVSSTGLAEDDLIYREISIRLKEIGYLLSTCTEPVIGYSFVNVPRLLVICTHLMASCGTNSFSIVTEDVLESVTYLFGVFVSSHRGVQEVASAFENCNLERAWFDNLLDEVSIGHSIIKELRQRPGVWSLAEEIKKSPGDIDIFPAFALSKLDIGIATATLLDGWRISQIILQLRLGDMEHVRRHLEAVSESCVDLAKMCSYDCGREGLCAAIIDTQLPIFFIALEKHSMLQSICETARYLTVQIFHTAVQYRSLLSATGEDTLLQLFRHIEPTTLSPMFFCPPPSPVLLPYINVFLEIIDHPHLLWTDINYAFQVCIVLSTISSICAGQIRYTELISALSDLRLPYSSLALICAALDEVMNAVSVLSHEQELAPGYLRYPKPPYPLSATEKRSNGVKVLQQFDAKTFILRSAINLCDLLLYVLQYYNTSREDEQIISRLQFDKRSMRYVVKSCIRSIYVSRTFREPPLSLAYKLERACLKILSKLTSIRFQHDLDSTNKDIVELVLSEILSEGRCSPRSCDTAVNILSFLTTEWKSRDTLINNQLLSTFHEMLRKYSLEFSELMKMWDGDCEHSLWLLSNNDAMMSVWGEILSQIESWILKGHSRYTLKWVNILRSLLVRSMENSVALNALDSALLERYADPSFEEWVEKISRLLPETEIEAFNEITALSALRRELTPQEATKAVMSKLPVNLA